MRHRAFTLVELLVVIVIILLVSAVTLPTVIPALSHRQVSEAARILQASLVQARDTAIRFNSPRGVRFLPDPTYASSPSILAYNRSVPIEPGPEYSNGLVTIWPDPVVFDSASGKWLPQLWVYTPAAYPFLSGKLGGPSGSVYPSYPLGSPLNPLTNGTGGKVLMLEQAPFQNNNAAQFVNAPTSWFWNIRVGDKIQINNTGNTYTVVGPCTVNPFSGTGNPELFVNVGQPGDTTGYLSRTYTNPGATATATVSVEFLYLVNGIDDDNDGYTDEGWDGVDNNQQMLVSGAWQQYGYNTIVDDLGDQTNIASEWEPEKWLGSIASSVSSPNTVLASYDTTVSSPTSGGFSLPAPLSYTITRRPVPGQSARETMLPNNVVIDATSWNSSVAERSRLPIDPFSKYVDILLLPSGQVVPTTSYSSPASFTLGDSFYHFWLSERQDVHELNELWGATTNPNTGVSFLLPMPQDAYNAYGMANFTTKQPQIALTGERMMVTLFSRTGQITTNSVEFFDAKNVSTPFYDSQLGAREAK